MRRDDVGEQVSLPTGTHSAGGVVPAGALSSYTGRLMSSRSFKSVRDVAKAFNKLLPSNIQSVNAKIDEYARGEVEEDEPPRTGRSSPLAHGVSGERNPGLEARLLSSVEHLPRVIVDRGCSCLWLLYLEAWLTCSTIYGY